MDSISQGQKTAERAAELQESDRVSLILSMYDNLELPPEFVAKHIVEGTSKREFFELAADLHASLPHTRVCRFPGGIIGICEYGPVRPSIKDHAS